jgi:hypothetical protein
MISQRRPNARLLYDGRHQRITANPSNKRMSLVVTTMLLSFKSPLVPPNA